MQSDSNLVGVWKTRTEYHSIPDSEAILIFKSDGIGWFKVSNDYKWEINFFQWAPTSTNWIVVTEVKRLEPHIHMRKATEVPLSFEWNHFSYKVHQSSKQLQIDWPQANDSGLNLSENLFDLTSLDVDAQDTPIR